MSNFKKANITDKKLDLVNFNKAMDLLNQLYNLDVTPPLSIHKTAGSVIISYTSPTSSGTGTMDASAWAFGYTITANSLSVAFNGGSLFHGTRTPLTLGATTVTVTHLYKMYVKWTIGMSIAWFPTYGIPVNTDTDIYFHIVTFTIVDSTVAVPSGGIGHLGDIHVPAVYA
jgi:hypothetical protein